MLIETFSGESLRLTGSYPDSEAGRTPRQWLSSLPGWRVRAVQCPCGPVPSLPSTLRSMFPSASSYWLTWMISQIPRQPHSDWWRIFHRPDMWGLNPCVKGKGLGQRTLQLPSLVMELTRILSHLPGENAAMQHTKATALYHSQHSFPVPPGTHYCWVTRGLGAHHSGSFYTCFLEICIVQRHALFYWSLRIMTGKPIAEQQFAQCAQIMCVPDENWRW